MQSAVCTPDDRNVGEALYRCARLFSAADTGQDDLLIAILPGYRIVRSEVHALLVTQARDEALRIMKDNPKLKGERRRLYRLEPDGAPSATGAG